jgi:hypothetical protein
MSMTPSGIEPTTFRFVAQYLNHCATISGPLLKRDMFEFETEAVYCDALWVVLQVLRMCAEGGENIVAGRVMTR